MEKLVEQLGINRLSKSQVSVMAKDLNAQVETSAPGHWMPARTPSSPP